jgi:hypothetical protein
VLAVRPAGADVLGGAGAFRGVRGRVGRRCAGGQRGFHGGGAQRRARHVDQRDVAVLDGAADYGPVDRPLGELLERPAGRGGLGHQDLGKQFVRLERGLEQAQEELPDTDLARAAGTARDDRRVQREQDGGQVGGGVGVRDRAADRATVPDLGVADLAGRVREQRHLTAEQPGVLDIVVPGQRADRDMRSLVGDVGKLTQATQVDDYLGGGQPQFHQRQQRMASGQELRVLAVFGHQVNRLFRRPGPHIGKRRGDHAETAAAASAALTML